MKRLKGFLDFVNSLFTAWPILVSAVLFLSAIVVGLSTLGNTTVQLQIPLSLLIGALALMLYPITKTIQWLVQKPITPFIYAGLLWKPSRVKFRYPQPYCPHDDCGCEVIIKAQPSVSLQSAGGPFIQAHSAYRSTYECPIHGVLNDVPDVEVAELQTKARLVQNHRRITSTGKDATRK